MEDTSSRENETIVKSGGSKQTVESKDEFQKEDELRNDTKLESHDNKLDDNDKKVTKQKSKKVAILRECIIYLAIIVVFLFFVPKYIIQRTAVDGPSMENNLHTNDQLLVEKLSYRFGELKRYDVIAFYPYGKDVKKEYYIKRIIGLPGETIQIIGSDIYIDGTILNEHYGKDPIHYAGIAEQPITLGEDEYFVLGDNREISKDSRSDDVGVVSKDQIGGKAILRIWPFKDFGTID